MTAYDNATSRREPTVADVTTDWTQIRPAPTARNAGEIDLAGIAVDELVHSGDPRLAAFGAGARLAIGWVTNGGSRPASGTGNGVPCLWEIADESHRAGQTAAGELPSASGTLTERDRIAARGVQEWLAWAYLEGYPTPLWLIGAMPAAEIHAYVLGGVGTGPGGLDGPATSESFAYSVDARIAGLGSDQTR